MRKLIRMGTATISAAGVVGTSIAMVAGLLLGAPPASAAVLDSAVSSQRLFSTPSVEDEQRALTTGARKQRFVNASLPMVGGATTFRTTFRPGAGFTYDKVVMQILMCPTANTLVPSDCTVVSDKELPGPFTSSIIRSDDLTIGVDDQGYGRIYRGNLAIYTNGGAGPTLNAMSSAYYGAMAQPKIGALRPGVVSNLDFQTSIDVAGSEGLNIYVPTWRSLPMTNATPRRIMTRWVCDSATAGQVDTYEWDTSGCDVQFGTQIATTGESSTNLNVDTLASSVGRYLVIEDTLSYSTVIAGGVSVTARSAPIAIVDSAAPQQNQGQQNQNAGQNQQNQNAGQNQGQSQGQGQQNQNQQNPNAAQPSGALQQPTGRAATLLRINQAPLVSGSGVGTVSGTTLTIDAPAIQGRGGKKQTYRVLVDPNYRGRVAMVLTRLTAKAKKMIVAKRTVRQTKKNGTAQIRWKMRQRMPAGTYTLYASFIPKKRYGKQGLTVSVPVQIR
jgi:hypothetical protein